MEFSTIRFEPVAFTTNSNAYSKLNQITKMELLKNTTFDNAPLRS